MAPFVGVKLIRFVIPPPRKFLPLSGEFVTAWRQLLCCLEQIEPGCEPLFACSGLMLSHVFSFHLIGFVFVVISACEPGPPFRTSGLLFIRLRHAQPSIRRSAGCCCPGLAVKKCASASAVSAGASSGKKCRLQPPLS